MKVKYKVFLLLTFIIIGLLSFIYYKEYNINNNIVAMNGKEIDTTNMISIMLETSDGTYSKSSSNIFPTEGYYFNPSKSGCENGGTLEWDGTSVTMTNATSDKCYLVFSLTAPETLSEHIINLYTGTEGDNALYYHNGSITNSDGTVLDANDYSYRFAGSNYSTHNYLCFGTDEKDCPEDNLYRIIGVFKNENGGYETKVIKESGATTIMLGTDGAHSGVETSKSYYWNNATNTNVWSESNLNTINLNTNYVNYLININDKWMKMIVSHKWIVGGINDSTWKTMNAAKIFNLEVKNPASSTIYTDEIGLPYVSDYAYSVPSQYWERVIADSNISYSNYEQAISYCWFMKDFNQNFITPYVLTSVDIFKVGYDGNVFTYSTGTGYTDGHANDGVDIIRSCFYLSSSINYITGDGTMTSPIRISL